MYQGLFNSSYVPTELELICINDSIYNYAEQQNKDPVLLRFLVYFSFLLCIAKSADTFSITWRMFVKQFGNYSSLAYGWTLDENATVACGCFIGLLVQSYFIYRTFMLSRSWYFLAIASLAALSGFIASVVLSVMISNPNGYSALPYLIAVNIMVIGAVLADGLITGFICFYFLKQSKMTMFSGTKELLARLITVSMQSAVPPLVCAILNLVFNFRFYEPDAPWANLFNMLMPYLYVISLLFTGSIPLGPTLSPDEDTQDFRWIDQSEHRATEVHISITSQSQQDSTK
ncbi:hypothetical protein FRC10_010278 [Ceratobasidium sp. 414]|nr:hypothetical protein FRC10_010278 [Ceratobasidium sp. 414]